MRERQKVIHFIAQATVFCVIWYEGSGSDSFTAVEQKGPMRQLLAFGAQESGWGYDNIM